MSRDFWPTCGYRLLRRHHDGTLALTDEFLRAALLRPELAPLPASSTHELGLHEMLMGEPRAIVPEASLGALEDADVAHNYRVWLRFRDRLVRASSIEAAYLGLFREGVDVPPVFVHQLTQIILRHVLGDEASAFDARAAEMLFRAQKITIDDDGTVVAADDQTVETQAMASSFTSVADLLRSDGVRRTVDLDVLSPDNAQDYWTRDERSDMALQLNRGTPGLDALVRVLERWIEHFLAVRVSIKAQREIDDRRWVWHVGLDAEASALLNDLYNRQEVTDERMARLLCLFELRFDDPAVMRAAIAGRPVYLAMCMDAQQRLRLKPQNLLLNLPLATTS